MACKANVSETYWRWHRIGRSTARLPAWFLTASPDLQDNVLMTYDTHDKLASDSQSTVTATASLPVARLPGTRLSERQRWAVPAFPTTHSIHMDSGIQTRDPVCDWHRRVNSSYISFLTGMPGKKYSESYSIEWKVTVNNRLSIYKSRWGWVNNPLSNLLPNR
jgi:hypothetical protein